MSRRRKMRPDEIPELPGYITVAALAERFDVDKSTIYYMLYSVQAFARPYKIMKGVKDERPLILLDATDAVAVMTERVRNLKRDAAVPRTAKNVRSWNLRVKDWGRETGWSQTRISAAGPPHKALADAYLAEHPGDVKPG